MKTITELRKGDEVTVKYKGKTITSTVLCKCGRSFKLVGEPKCMHHGEYKIIPKNPILTNLLGVVK